jgi:NAD-dependent SIR2 family protein deacetylase
MHEGTNEVARAAAAIASADALLITAGAGIGVDSGLPDFRGDEGFWKAYPAYAHLGLSFVDLANPRWFETDPHLAWGFYGHRLNLYRATEPHDGFARLRAWGASCRYGAFVFTSNVDHQFQRAGFASDRIVECHGSIEVWQCTRACGVGLFAASDAEIAVDSVSFRAETPHPGCPGCGALARPNILMFGDDAWESSRTDAQHRRLERWLKDVGPGRLTIIECGAGRAVPTVRSLGERLARRPGVTLVRINPREPQTPAGGVSLAVGARQALADIDAVYSQM